MIPKTEFKARSGVKVHVYHFPDTNRVICNCRGRRIRRTFANTETAVAFARDMVDDLNRGYDPATSLSSDQRALYHEAIHKLDGTPLMEAVNFFLAHKRAANAATVAAMSESLLTETKRRGRSNEHISNLRKIYALLATRHPGPMHLITTAELETFCLAKSSEVAHRRNYLMILWRYARRKGALPLDRPLAIEGVHRPTYVPADPVITDAHTISLYLEAYRQHAPSILPMVVLAAFCGIRRAELLRLRWCDILPTGYVLLSSSVTKTRKRRMVPIPPNAIAWLRLCQRGGDPETVIPRDHARHIAEFYQKSGLASPPRNVLRHTAATMMLARGDAPHAVASALGNSVEILESHYKGLASPAEAAEYFSVIPKQS